jgi:peptidoglycan/xylan/chitin deacetylase (PgdA/CDA1 family)
MKNIFSLLYIGLFFLVGCNSKTKETKTEVQAIVKKTIVSLPIRKDNTAEAILAKKEVPVLCYHNIRDFTATASGMIKTYTVKPAAFAEQMKALSDAGYHTVLPNQLREYLLHDAPLPEKPVMITFDDTRGEQFSIGASEMDKYGFKGVFFVMTVSINRPNYLTKDEIKNLSDSGHVIAAHTWDHHMVTKYTGDDWNTQLVKPKKKLEDIIGRPVTYFAYPFGLWNKEAITKVKESGYQMAFILSAKRDSIDPLYTIRRIIVSGTSSSEGMIRSMESSFDK